jgi:leucyl-tRNA synthetase
MYNPIEIEAKWQKYWLTIKHLQHTHNSEKPKHYVSTCFLIHLVGLHVGHPAVTSHLMCIQIKDQGYNVLHPMDDILVAC